ncbi:hypothetical protein CV770_26765 [Bradyrhizobium sp. AC87j1]|uniref:hypothetical protein n=1 Tax=Bradyrhizobium sp. AC87j1 TaxID=2055894 RepID=UPI000CEC6535|nr:hypothetical protein [Bradyrhizobium sp. AC87j1]PPQ16349.1 hypothetical protein CV770_26765 [Bradyrhizobium sp. AC87j1]
MVNAPLAQCTYLVRIIETRDFVGIFVADDEDDLAFIMDECTDAPGCEYVELPMGGIMWESPAKPVPLKTGDPEDMESEPEEFPWAGASLTERWWYIAYGMEEVEWTLFEGIPRPTRTEPVTKRPLNLGRVLPFRKRSLE